MKFSTAALVLATLAVESASAASLKHAHRHSHQKKEAKPVDKRVEWTPPPGYDPHWTPPAGYNPFATSTAGAAAPASTYEAASSVVQQAPASSSVQAPASSVKASTPSASASSTSSGDDTSGSLGGTLKSYMSELNTLISGANLKMTNSAGKAYLADGTVLAGLNPTSASGFAWLGEDDSAAMVNEMCNESGGDVTVVMWETSSSSNMFVTSAQPAIAVKIPSGGSITVSHAAASGAWAALYEDTAMAWPGFIHNTLGEFTFGNEWPTFDVSRESAINGNHMSITDGTCTSTSLDGGKCLFECIAPEDDKGGDWCTTNYHMVNTSGQSECNQGERNGKDEGGCQTKGKKVKTTFH